MTSATANRWRPASLGQFGVTPGSDLTGQFSKAAFSGGFGVQVPINRWYVDGGIRVTSIRTEGHATNVLRAGATFGVTF